MLAGGMIFGGSCKEVEVTFANTDINGDGVVDRVGQSYCEDTPPPSRDDFFVWSGTLDSSFTRSGSLSPKGLQRFFQYTGTASPTDTTLCLLERCQDKKFAIGDLVELPDGSIDNIHLFAFNVDAQGVVHAAQALFNVSDMGEVPLSQLQKITSMAEEMKKGDAILGQIQKKHARDLAEMKNILAYADFASLKEPYRSKVVRLVENISGTIALETFHHVRGWRTQLNVREQLQRQLGIPADAWRAANATVAQR